MSIKFTALAAAAIATLGTATLADNSFFSFQERLNDGSILELGTVTSEGNGVVEIYDYHGGEIGALLGSEDVHFGANANVRIPVGVAPNSDVIALLKVDGQTVATRDYDLD